MKLKAWQTLVAAVHMVASTTQERAGGRLRQGFHIAVLLIGGSLLLIGIPAIRGGVQGAKELAAVFSGWIAAIVGFYFLQGQAQQAAAAAEEAERERNASAMREMTVALENLRRQNEKFDKGLQKVINSLPEYQEEAEGP